MVIFPVPYALSALIRYNPPKRMVIHIITIRSVMDLSEMSTNNPIGIPNTTPTNIAPISELYLFICTIVANIELNRPIYRRDGEMERIAWWVNGTETEAERQELSGERYKGRQQTLVREFLTGAGRPENHTKWARFQRLVRLDSITKLGP